MLTVRQAPSPDALQRARAQRCQVHAAGGAVEPEAGAQGGRGEGSPGARGPAVCPLPSLRPHLPVSLSASPYSSLSASSVSLGLSASLSLTLCPPRPTPSLTVGVSLGDDVASSAVADLPSGGVLESGGGRARGSGRWVGVSTQS